MSEIPLQAREAAQPGSCLLRVVPRRAEVLDAPGGRCTEGLGWRIPLPRPPSTCCWGWNRLQTPARGLASGRLTAQPSRAGTRVGSPPPPHRPPPGCRALILKHISTKSVFLRGTSLSPNPARIADDCRVRVGLWVAGKQTFTKVRLGRGTTFRAY